MSEYVRLRISADRERGCRFTVQFEPLGVQYQLGPGESVYVEIPRASLEELDVIYWGDGVSFWPPGPAFTYDSQGNQLDERSLTQ